MMSWTDNKILLDEDPRYVPCGEIFQAACDEIGKHYQLKGYKYSRSRPKITINDADLKVEICFWSFRSNIPGDSVLLEILPNFYSKKISKEKKTKGFLLGHTALFYHKYSSNPKLIKVRHIYGDESERIDEFSDNSCLIDSHICNVYGLNEAKFKKIIEFIDTKIICWVNKLKTEAGILELTDNASTTRKQSLNGKGGNSEFIDFVNLYFPNLDIEKRLAREE